LPSGFRPPFLQGFNVQAGLFIAYATISAAGVISLNYQAGPTSLSIDGIALTVD
jgi:hypothetical protein